ncbi:hypothetical protein U91I_03781 [alpha proteobacterium U9-1i]|nr:hypothetical protein U91I_03781 [alpha proteobacterium U9-1i]
MRNLFSAAALFALAACGQTETGAPAASTSTSACAREATHEISWSSEDAADIVTASSSGPSCAQAVVTLIARDADGDPLLAFSSSYYDLTAGGVGPEGPAAVSDEQMDTFLQGWANVSLMPSSELPEWREGAATLTESVQGFSYDTPFGREAYEMLRTSGQTLLCYAASAEGSQCLIMDPATQSSIPFVAFGP